MRVFTYQGAAFTYFSTGAELLMPTNLSPMGRWHWLAVLCLLAACKREGPGPVTGDSREKANIALVGLEPEQPGVNCANGGVSVSTGVDDDGDGTLEPGEVDATAYVCNGSNGEQGMQGNPGETGENGDPGNGVVWIDATGAEAVGVVSNPACSALGVCYIDANGTVWGLDASTGQILVNANNYHIGWSSPGCSGTAYVVNNSLSPIAAPRFPIFVGDGSIRVRGDDAAEVMFGECSSDFGGGCSVGNNCSEVRAGIELGKTTLVTVPAFPYSPPLHPALSAP